MFLVRAQGKVVRVERRVEDGEPRMGVAAVIERYDIIRGEPREPDKYRGFQRYAAGLDSHHGAGHRLTVLLYF